MYTVLLTVHILFALAMIGLILVQRSDQDGFGLGGGGGANALFSGRTAANLLTRTTAILATGFMLTSLALGVYSARSSRSSELLDAIQAQPAPSAVPADPQAPAPAPAAPSVPVAE